MSRQKRSIDHTVISSRLQAAIDKWPERRGVRTLAELLKGRSPRPRGSTPAMIHRYLRGAVTPPVEFIQAAADVLGVDASWLAGGSSVPAAETPWVTSVRDGELNAAELRGLAVDGLTTRLPRFHFLPLRTQRAALEAVEAWARWSLDQNADRHENDPETLQQWTVEEWGEAALYVGMTLAEAFEIPNQHLPEDVERDGHFLADVATALVRRIPSTDEKRRIPPIKKRGTQPIKASNPGGIVAEPRRKHRGKA